MQAVRVQEGGVLHLSDGGPRGRGGVRAAGGARRGDLEGGHHGAWQVHEDGGRQQAVRAGVRAGPVGIHGAHLRALGLLVREHSGADGPGAGRALRLRLHDAQLRPPRGLRDLRLLLHHAARLVRVERGARAARDGVLLGQPGAEAEGHRALREEDLHGRARRSGAGADGAGAEALHQVPVLRVRDLHDGRLRVGADQQPRVRHDLRHVSRGAVGGGGRGHGVAPELRGGLPRVLLREGRGLPRGVHDAPRPLLLRGGNAAQRDLPADALRRIRGRPRGATLLRLARRVGPGAGEGLPGGRRVGGGGGRRGEDEAVPERRSADAQV